MSSARLFTKLNNVTEVISEHRRGCGLRLQYARAIMEIGDLCSYFLQIAARLLRHLSKAPLAKLRESRELDRVALSQTKAKAIPFHHLGITNDRSCYRRAASRVN